MTGPGYETARELTQRTGKTDTVVCAGCGVFVMNVAAHTRFHSALAGAPEVVKVMAWRLPAVTRARLAAVRAVDRAAVTLIEHDHLQAAVALWRVTGLWGLPGPGQPIGGSLPPPDRRSVRLSRRRRPRAAAPRSRPGGAARRTGRCAGTTAKGRPS